MRYMKNIVLIGFMGTGKSSTGRALANKLGYAFIDIDQKIEEEQGMSIPKIFELHGESFFRDCEKQMVKRVAERRNTVIATGGGTVKDPENMEELRKHGFVVCLSANVETVLERTRRRGTRPVLDGKDDGDRRKAVESLMEERKGLYDQADYTVDTSNLSPLQVIDDIVQHLRARGI